MQQIDSSWCDIFTITYVVDITFGINPKKSKYILSQMKLHFINNIFSFPKYPNQNTNVNFTQLTSF
jgi:hypothetical protein